MSQQRRQRRKMERLMKKKLLKYEKAFDRVRKEQEKKDVDGE